MGVPLTNWPLTVRFPIDGVKILLQDRFKKYSENISNQQIFLCAGLVAIVYMTRLILVAMNADDIVQVQPGIIVGYTFLSQGRWGYYFIYEFLLEANPFGVLENFLGVLAITWAAYLGGYYIGLRKSAALSVFILVSTISVFYGYLFSYDSTRLAYPIGTLLSVLGIVLVSKGHRLGGFILMSFGPAFYPVASEVVAVLVLGRMLLCLADGKITDILKVFFLHAAALILSMGFYLLLTNLFAIVFDFTLVDRFKISIAEALQNYQRILILIRTYANPLWLGEGVDYIRPYLRILIGVGFLVFLAVLIGKIHSGNRLARGILMLPVLALLLMAPFALAFASPLDEFSSRAMIGYATVHALFLAVPVEYFVGLAATRRVAQWLAEGVIGLAALILLENALAISKMTADEYLAYQEDILATNRIIYRIDEVWAEAGLNPAGPIPLVVQYSTHTQSGPRKPVYTSRYNIWSREYIFRLIDHRFQPIMEEAERLPYLGRSGSRGKWPSKDAVFVVDGVVVAIIE